MFRAVATAVLGAAAVVMVSAAPAFAGNIALTGHDSDFHCSPGFLAGANCVQELQLITFARAGSSNPSLKVLVFDDTEFGGGDVTADLTAMGIPFDNIATTAAIATANFDPTVYSAFVVASDVSCGGCDNSAAYEAALAARIADITTFFNAGGGIMGFSGASNAANYYKFVPQTASGFGSPGSSPYFGETCFGIAFTPVNGDPTHNFFPEPGTGGVSSLYCVAERFGNAVTGTAETLVLQGGTIVTDVITTTTTTGGAPVPEPATLSLLGIGAAVAAYRRRRRT